MYDKIIARIIEEPGIAVADLSKEFLLSEAWLEALMKSHSFSVRMATAKDGFGKGSRPDLPN